jgi:N12 class adenine-specific DNA methylase
MAADAIQLNLFGDIVNLDQLTSEKDVNDDYPEPVRTDGTATLGKVSSQVLPDSQGAGDTGRDISQRRGSSEIRDGRSHDKWVETQRSPGDSTQRVHLPTPGGEGGTYSLEISPLFNQILSSEKLLLSEQDIQTILNQYAAKHCGFSVEVNRSGGMQPKMREASGQKLWEDMSFDEKTKEFYQYMQEDFSIAHKESKDRNPVDYLLDRALDPLDPMSEVYKVILRNAGAEIADNGIKLPEHLQIIYKTVTPQISHTDLRGNYHITAENQIGAGGKVAKFNANLEAITLLKIIEAEGRKATPLEQSILVKYTGWGGLSEAFKESPEGNWLERTTALKEALTPNEYAKAARSTLNAHYTDPDIIDSVWTAVCRMGYNGGPTLEPATGVGHFFGKRPTHLPIEMFGIEQDSISGRIAQQLYQSANIRITGYENVKMFENCYNLVISNVPFGDIYPYEEKRNKTPGLTDRYAIHDYYFLKSLYGTKEGGLVAFITSHYTMDKLDTEVREKIAEKADFIGAIRLPNNAFTQIAHTEVVTDIVFLQKRSPYKEMSDLTKDFITTGNVNLVAPDGTQQDHTINSYYIKHPEMIMGTQDLSGTMYSGNEYTVTLTTDDLKQRLDAAIMTLPENIMSIIIDRNTEELDDSVLKATKHIHTDSIPFGTFIIGSDDKLYQKHLNNGNVVLSDLYKSDSHNEIDRIKSMVSIRDCVKDAIDHYYNNQSQSVKQDLDHLNTLYDAFVKEYGYLNARKNVYAFNEDPDSSLLQSLENWNPKTKTATKAAIFEGISFVRKEVPTSVDNPVDAMILSLSRYGNLNMHYMESLTGSDRNSIVTNLSASGYIYQDPYDYITNNKTSYLSANEYLCGNIREKLRYAQEAAQKDPVAFSRNVIELTKILPKDLEPQDIAIRINTPVVGDKNVKAFVCELLQLHPSDVRTLHIPLTGKWDIHTKATSVENESIYGTSHLNAIKIIGCLMNGKPVKVYQEPIEKGDPPVLDYEATAAAELKAEAINNAFAQWIWKDQARTDDIVKRYNEVYNSHVERNYTHPERILNPNAEIWMHGCAFPFPMRANQADAIWRVVQDKNSMLAHSVGAGKTLEMACSAMELRRLGLRNKPMIVCPDHLIGQWGSEFRQAYPAAKLLIADDLNWDQENRRVFINRIATGDWDAVLIRSESFKMIPMSNEFQIEFFEKKLSEYKEILRTLDSSSKKTRSVKDLEKAAEKYEEKIKELTDAHRDEGVIPFDKLGIDHLFADEADIYKNLEYYTQLQNVRGLGDSKGSECALDMLMKVRFIQSIDGGITFATGTPISNTLVEAYTMQRFLQPEVLKANGIEAFDEWARQYAESVTQMELNNTGTGYTPVTRFSRIVNVPELVSSLRQTWDIQTASTLETNGILVPGVNLPYKNIHQIAAPNTPLLQSYLGHLEERERLVKQKGKPKKGMDNVLSIMTDGRKAAIDLRFINPQLPDDPNSKLNLAVNYIVDFYNKYKTERYTCAVFFDKARSLEHGIVKFDGIMEITRKLMERGIDLSEIGDVRSCKTFQQRQQLFERVREGQCRIIFGSTENMGAGTNFQKKLKAIYHIDAPWRPRDIEQQNGRGYRPGNTTGELDIYYFVTKGSLDTGLWNVLETKATSIRQVMDGTDKTTRTIEENYYGSIKELSIDNPLMKESLELDHDLRKLRSQYRAFQNDLSSAHRRCQRLPNEIITAEEHVKKIETDMQSRPELTKKDEFAMTINGTIFTERKLAGDAILKELATLNLQVKASHADKNVDLKIGNYLGYPLYIRSSIYNTDIGHMGELSIQAPQFRYSIDVKNTSDPTRLPVTLHSQIYKGMDSMHQSALQGVTTLKKNLDDAIAQTKAEFPKETEIHQKEARNVEVLALLKKQAEEKPAQEKNPHDIPWHNLDSMTHQQINSCLKAFYENVKFTPQVTSEVPEIKLKTGEDIAALLLKSHDHTLAPPIITILNNSFTNGTLKQQPTHELVCSIIDDFRINGPVWNKSQNLEGVHSVYARNVNSLTTGDIIIKALPSEKDQKFDAYKIENAGTTRHLGSDTYDSIKNRVENYVLSNHIKNKLSETIALSVNNSLREPRASYGLEI